MLVDSIPVWSEKGAYRPAEVLADISDVQTTQSFLLGVMAEKEILEISARLEAAELLRDGDTDADITQRMGLGSRTITRISTELVKGGCGGCRGVIGSTLHHGHTRPARAG